MVWYVIGYHPERGHNNLYCGFRFIHFIQFHESITNSDCDILSESVEGRQL
jgi:hypothetical protein